MKSVFLSLFVLCALSACSAGPEPNPSGSITSKETGAGTVTSATTLSKVPAPGYDFDTSGLMVGLDARNEITRSTGNLLLLPGAVPAQDYILGWGGAPSTIADIQTVYQMAVQMGAVHAITNQIPAESFLPLGTSVPAERTMILRNLGEGGVAAYELFTMHVKLP